MEPAEDDQGGYTLRFGWGPVAAGVLARGAGLVVIVDVLRFSTAVTVAVERGAIVYPYAWSGVGAESFAAAHSAVLAGSRGAESPSLSPVAMARVQHGDRIVLPSPNGAACVLVVSDQGSQDGSDPDNPPDTSPDTAPDTSPGSIVAGSLRNAGAVAALGAGTGAGETVAVIAAGERWRDGSLRPCAEDLLGAGAILDALVGGPGGITAASPDARLAAAAYRAGRGDLLGLIRESASGRELIARGLDGDVVMAAELDVTAVVPSLVEGAFSASRRDSLRR
jgi:2-phosphosulfolactate phosphatase